MRFMIFLVMVFGVISVQALEQSLCVGDSLKVTRISSTNVIMCDCQCTNEENIFYIKPSNLEIMYKIEASRLVSQKTISQSSSNTFCNDNILSEKKAQKFLAFITKAPTENGGICFEVLENGLNKKGVFERNKLGIIEKIQINHFLKKHISINKAYLYYYYSDSILIDNLESDFYKFLQSQDLQKFVPIKTKMYLVKGDKVTILDKKTDDIGQKWYFINYKGTKDLTMWIKAESVDIPKAEELPEQQTEPHTQNKTSQQLPIISKTKTPVIEEKTTVLSVSNKITPSQVQQESSAGGGPLPLSLLASLLWLFAFRLS